MTIQHKKFVMFIEIKVIDKTCFDIMPRISNFLMINLFIIRP